VEKLGGDQGRIGLSRWERLLASLALVACIFAIIVDGPARWFALPCIAVLFVLALTSTNRTERVLAQTQEDYRGLLEMIGSSTDSIIYAKDREGRMLYANRALERLAGIPIEHMLGKTDTEWNPSLPEAEALQNADRLVLATGASQDLEEVFTGKDGVPRHYQTLKSPLRDKTGAVIGVVGVSTDISDARESEQREKLLSRELDHRAKNLLAVVQSVVSLTRADNLADFKRAVEGRIQSLGRAHSMLAASRWEGADLERVLAEELAPYRSGEEARVHLSGPSLLLKPAAAQSLALVFHELATNAVKYGALSVPAGELHVHWLVSPGEDGVPRLVLRWTESGGPPVKPRSSGSRSGFGSRLIRSSIERQLAGTLRIEWAESGLRAEMEIAIDRSLHEVVGEPDGTGRDLPALRDTNAAA
jgi:PAS domain S-box-containing protein